MNEITRILNLPVAANDRPSLPDLGPGTPSLRPAQVLALREYVRALRDPAGVWGARGGVAGLGCGHGKTLVALLLPIVHQRVTGHWPRVVNLMPAALLEQFDNDRAAWGVIYPDLIAHPSTALSHEGLSAPSGKARLRAEAPDVIVIDEAHAFADPESGRWRRIVDYLKARPDCRIVVMSGSFSWKSVRQVRHVYLAALRDWCPLPADSTIASWATCLDVGGEPSSDDRALLAPLLTWAGTDDARAAYYRRLATTPGVTLTSELSSNAPLRCVLWRPALAPAVDTAVADLDARWVLPDGTELVSALDVARHGGSIPLGYYQRWVPPIDEEWLARRRAWSGVVRGLVLYAPGVYQTPGAVLWYAREGKLDARSQRLYNEWLEVEDLEPPKETVWLDDAEDHIRQLVEEWAANPTRGSGAPLVWVDSPVAGEAVARALGWSYHGAGGSPPAGRAAVVSMDVFATGWDGAPAAGYRGALVLQPPASAKTWEQLLARLHRNSGNRADEIVYTVLGAGKRAYKAIAAGVAGARYVQETTRASQRILLANWEGIHVDRVGGFVVGAGTEDEDESAVIDGME